VGEGLHEATNIYAVKSGRFVPQSLAHCASRISLEYTTCSTYLLDTNELSELFESNGQ
jgi:hypothetical protein